MVQNMMARRPMGKPKVLLLGISYPCVEKQMEKHGFEKDLLVHRGASVERAVECVRRGILTEMDARDLARCLATEEVCDVDCYSSSREIGAVYRDDRHVYGDFNNRNFCKSLKKAFGDDVQFSQVILDYYWMPSGWLVTRWAKTLFQQTLPDLVKLKMLTYPSSRSRNRAKFEEGVVYLPFCAHVCKELVGGINVLSQYYAISFVKKSELEGHSLWKGTMSIDGAIMQHVLGKRLDQEEVYCTFRKKDIFENMEDSHVSKPAVMKVLEAIEDYDNIRMIRLRPLRQHEGPSVMKIRRLEIEEGGFVGLNYELAKEKRKNAELEAKRKKEQARKEKLREQKEAERKQKQIKRKAAEEKRRKKQVELAKAKKLKAQKEAARVVSHVEEIPLDESKYKIFFPGPAACVEAYIEAGHVVLPELKSALHCPSRINSPPIGSFSTVLPKPSWMSAHNPSSTSDDENRGPHNASALNNSARMGTSTKSVSEPRKQFLAHNPRLARNEGNRPEEIEYDDCWEGVLDVNIKKGEIDANIETEETDSDDGMEVRYLDGEQLEKVKRAGYCGSAVQYVYIPEHTHEVHVACKLMGMRMMSRGCEEVSSKIFGREETTCFRVPEHNLKAKELSQEERVLYERWKISIARSAFGSTSPQDGLLYLSRLERMNSILDWFKYNLNPLFDPGGYFARTVPKIADLWGNEGMLEKAEALELHIHEEAMALLDEQSNKSDEWKSLNESISRWLQNETNVGTGEAEEFYTMKEKLAHGDFKSDACLAGEMADRILFLRQIFDWKSSAAPVVPAAVETTAEQEMPASHGEKTVLRENRKRPREASEHEVDFIEKKFGQRKVATNIAPKQVERVCKKKISTTSNDVLKASGDRQKLQRRRGDSIGQRSSIIPHARLSHKRASILIGNSRKGKDIVHQRDTRQLVGTFNTTTENAENFYNEASSKIGRKRAQSLCRILMYLQNPEAGTFAQENPGIHYISRLISCRTPLFQKAMMVEAIVHGLSEAHGQNWIHKSHHRDGFGLLMYELLRDIESLQRIPNDAYEFKALMCRFQTTAAHG